MGLLCTALQLYVLLIFLRIVLSWFPVTPDTAMASVAGALIAVTEPVLGPVRRALPPVRMGGMGLDLSPIIVVFGLQLIVLPIVC
ncbi:MAG: YggT family protein [Acidimicrobiaceae bacterium]